MSSLQGLSGEAPDRARRFAPSRGAIMAAVIVCLMVVMLLGAAIVQNLVMRQRQTQTELRRLQTFWFAESALERALGELSANPKFDGGEWRVELPSVAGSQTAVAEIRIESDDSSPRQRKIRVVARWPDEPVHRCVHHLDLVTTLPDRGDTHE